MAQLHNRSVLLEHWHARRSKSRWALDKKKKKNLKTATLPLSKGRGKCKLSPLENEGQTVQFTVHGVLSQRGRCVRWLSSNWLEPPGQNLPPAARAALSCCDNPSAHHQHTSLSGLITANPNFHMIWSSSDKCLHLCSFMRRGYNCLLSTHPTIKPPNSNFKELLFCFTFWHTCTWRLKTETVNFHSECTLWNCTPLDYFANVANLSTVFPKINRGNSQSVFCWQEELL